MLVLKHSFTDSLRIISLILTFSFASFTVSADIKSDLAASMPLPEVIKNSSDLGTNPDEIVRTLIQNKVDPAEATKYVIEAFPGYIHATSITRTAIGEAPFSAASIVGAAISSASEYKEELEDVAVKEAPAQKKAIGKSADKAAPPFVDLTTLHKKVKKEPKKTARQLRENANAGLAGVVLATRGEVTATNASGQSRRLYRRSKFYSKDIIKTGKGSSAQLRFEDRAVMGLRENSELNITKYHFGGTKDDENNVAMKLVSGGFRTISGTIGKSNKEAYSVSTPAASIGIRGTDYDLVITLGGLVVAAVWDGGITIANSLGSLNIGSNSNYIFASIGAGAQPTPEEVVPAALLVDSGSATSLNAEQKADLIEYLEEKGAEISEEIAEFLEDTGDDEDEGDDEGGDDGGDDEGGDDDGDDEDEFDPADEADSPS